MRGFMASIMHLEQVSDVSRFTFYSDSLKKPAQFEPRRSAQSASSTFYYLSTQTSLYKLPRTAKTLHGIPKKIAGDAIMDTNRDTNSHEFWLHYTSGTICASILACTISELRCSINRKIGGKGVIVLANSVLEHVIPAKAGIQRLANVCYVYIEDSYNGLIG